MKTLIWDYNGTIIDDAGISLQVENLMLEERHLPAGYTLDQYRDLYRMPMIDYYREIGYTFETETFADVAVEFNRLYDELFHTVTLCRGVIEKLEEAVHKGYVNVILSSCENGHLHEQCRHLGITKYFREIMGIDNLLGEPKIELGKHWMIRSGVKPDECLYLGDTKADHETASALSIENCILVASGHQSYQRLKEVSDHVVHDLSEVKL